MKIGGKYNWKGQPERPDWIVPFPGRAHHADWCADVTHPDMRLMAAAPDMLSALQAVTDFIGGKPDAPEPFGMVRDAIAKALGHNALAQGAAISRVPLERRVR